MAAFAASSGRHPRVWVSEIGTPSEGQNPYILRRVDFRELLLPALCGRAKAIILEISLPRNDCGDQRVVQVEKAQEPVTATQAKSNKDDTSRWADIAKRWASAIRFGSHLRRIPGNFWILAPKASSECWR